MTKTSTRERKRRREGGKRERELATRIYTTPGGCNIDVWDKSLGLAGG